MCLLSFHWQPNSPTPLTLVANRDEFHERPALPAQFWPEQPHILAGKDLTAGGTWLGVTKEGFFAALTNVRQIPASHTGDISRGQLVLDYLSEQPNAQDYLHQIHQQAQRYDGFNLIVGNRHQCWYYSNRPHHQPTQLAPGLYGLSNDALDTPWPKVTAAKSKLESWLQDDAYQSVPLHELLFDTQTYPEALQPDTGIGQPWETLLSSAFIISENYGTRASTALQIHDRDIHFQEASFNPSGNVSKFVHFDF